VGKGKRGPARGLWIAWPLDFDRHPAIKRFRADAEDPNAEMFFLRAMIYCRTFAQHGCLRPGLGTIADHWEAVAVDIGWPGGAGKAEELRDLWRACGLVVGDVDQLLWWELYTGWTLNRYKADQERHAETRKLQEKIELEGLRQKAKKKGKNKRAVGG
jgi:hypothetical protein